MQIFHFIYRGRPTWACCGCCEGPIDLRMFLFFYVYSKMSLRDFLSSPVWAEMLMFNLLILFCFVCFFSFPGVYFTWASVAWLECYASPARTRAETNDSCCYLKQCKRLNICTTLARHRASPHFDRPLRPLDLVFALPTLAAVFRWRLASALLL